MIIGISGYIGSGKDTVGQMIQKLTTPKPSVHEEDEFGRPARYINGDYVLKPEYSIWKIKKFAAKLKQIASLLTGFPVEKFEEQEFKKSILPQCWDYMVLLPPKTLDQAEKYWEERQMTVREFLQKLGTEAIRTNLHENAWVNATFADYEGDRDFWVITDARFPNEAKAIKDRGGLLVRVNRMVSGIEESVMRHPSETGLDDWKFDYIINNDGSLEDLEKMVHEMLRIMVARWKKDVVRNLNFERACYIRDIEKAIIP